MAEQLKDKVAFVTGANGITGAYILAQLASEPHWTRIIATSRRKPRLLPKDPRIEFAQADLNVDVEQVEVLLREAKATGVTHFFHMAYVHHAAFDKQFEYNVPFFRNILYVVDKLNRDTLERVILQTGGKHYGSFSKKAPERLITEDLGRVKDLGRPNFYYAQEDYMFELQEGKKWTWTVTRPFMINGFSYGSGQSFATTAALYFTIQRYLGEEAVFSLLEEGDETSYTKRWDASSASNIAAFTTFAACHPGAADQAYNVVDNDPNEITFGDIWRYIGEYFGVPVTTKKGYNAEHDIQAKLDRGVWKDIVKKYGGDPDACVNYGTWWFFQFQMAITFKTHVSMDKARRELGWTTRCDTREELGKIFKSMEEAGIIPNIP
ncbi:hypothetical protein CEP52_011491 [Fusarium oligoseptatum]|uniref:PRISE-like Rossmann-fold domain-containing protein n=1 Tax=Fusarium oligoseptatum TaxID=2604345 RepID=A0A428T2Z7_9HYPO|nr:hypothetical protein CEP52_011491 [Fusarium oligoseptatum]